ncbi:MAG: PD-(D/E)XK nuclease family protein [Vicinamibacterales bacterium]
MITPRLTCLVSAPDLASYREAILERACEGSVGDIRGRAVIVPSRAAAEQLRRTIEDRRLGAGPGTVVLPWMLTREEWRTALYGSLPGPQNGANAFEREVLLQASARAAAAGGAPPPFTIRPGLISEMLAFYDAVRRHGRSVADFERVAVVELESAVHADRGAVRLLEQTRFLVAAFRRYEALLAEQGVLDEHGLTAAVVASASSRFTHVVVAVGDRAGDASGFWPSDFDLLTRIAGLARLDVVATRAVLGAGLRERLRRWLPEHEEIEAASRALPAAPTLLVPADGDAAHWMARDREEELALVARHAKRAHRRHPDAPLSRTAVVFKRPLPYVYLARQIFTSAGVPYQAFDALPLAAEPYAAALDLVFDAVDSKFARSALIALLRSPLFAYRAGGRLVDPAALAQLDRKLSEARYLAEPEKLSRFAREWTSPDDLRRAARAAAEVAEELTSLSSDGPPSRHLDSVIRFLDAHERPPRRPRHVVERHLRVRSAVLTSLARLRDAHRIFDDAPRAFADTAAGVRRWIEQQTFAPREGDAGIQVLDADSARFGEFDTIHLVGLTQQEWPESASQSIFYPPAMLKDLHWPEDADVRTAERARFEDLLHAAARQVRVSTITLEHDALVEPSPFLDDLGRVGLVIARAARGPDARIFAAEALLRDPQRPDALGETASAWLALRQSRTAADDARFHGQADAAPSAKYRVSSIDQYLACPFVYFSTRVLRLAEEPEDEEALGPRAQGTLVHEVLQAFFEAWQARGGGAITLANLDDARAQFAAIAEARLAMLPETDAALQRVRLLGSPVAEGFGDVVLAAEAERDRGVPVVERLMEFTLDGETPLGSGDAARTIRLAAKADRIDLLEDGTFRVFDYKLSRAPNLKHVAQLPAYAAAARERLAGRHGRAWRASEAAYVSFGKGGHYEPLAGDDEGLAAALSAGEARLVRAVDGIERGAFPPAPVEEFRCTYCPFSGVCRKDYVRGE